MAGYYTRNSGQSASLIRARRPYLVKNAITGLGVAGIAIGVWRIKSTDPPADIYTLRAVGQDDFEDVKVPDVPVTQAQELNTPKK
ncbi:hypothetical protein VPNG_01801 [Cytospora leucostoma]|uniref:Cytochrome c oxidase assembly factor 3 n=1 Tax=Cytospora leucostoma TaxID=1230097 RepID=A0A423XIH6_9PEZI|nr:hypothetical protein VPNG_01801 [Cytospora leucostoma]